MKLFIHPITQKEANVLVKRWHRHHKPAVGGLFAVAVAIVGADEPCGIAIVGRPSARMLDDGWTVEVTRCATDGTPNACSKLYGATQRIAKELGYRKWLTYTLPSEGGASLRAVNLINPVVAGGGQWHRESRPRVEVQTDLAQKKLKWVKKLDS